MRAECNPSRIASQFAHDSRGAAGSIRTAGCIERLYRTQPVGAFRVDAIASDGRTERNRPAAVVERCRQVREEILWSGSTRKSSPGRASNPGDRHHLAHRPGDYRCRRGAPGARTLPATTSGDRRAELDRQGHCRLPKRPRSPGLGCVRSQHETQTRSGSHQCYGFYRRRWIEHDATKAKETPASGEGPPSRLHSR